MSVETDSKIIKAATSEWTLLAFRAGTTIMLAIIVNYVVGTKTDLAELTKEVYNLRISQTERVAKLEGEVSQVNTTMADHRSRLSGMDGDMRTVWNRLYEFSIRLGQAPRNGP